MSTFGESLKRERELRQISLREIAEATKINLRYLDALETNKFDNLPGGVFNRGFVRAYAQYIGADADSLVNAYLLESREQFKPTAGSDQLLRRLAEAKEREGEGVRAGPGPAVRRFGVVTLVALGAAVAGAGVWYGWNQRGSGAGSTVAETAAPAAADRGASDEVAAEPTETPPQTPPEQAAPSSRQDAVDESVAKRETTSVERSATLPERDTTPPPIASATPALRTADRTAESEAPSPAPRDDVIRVRLVIVRETSGRLNCDGRQVEMLDGMPAGTALEMTCRSYLVLDATDGGGVKLGLGGATPVALVADGVPLRGYRIVPGSAGVRDDGAPS